MKIDSLIKKTNAYKIFSKDKINNTLSHATLVVCDDSEMLESYLKVFAKTLMCDSLEYCGECRVCKLIDAKNYEDVKFYPENNKILTKDVDDLIEKSYLKPLESDKKLFVLVNAQDMNVQSQNKLLKTLEEPPENTYLLLGATSVFTLLSTVLSRVKRLDILPFSASEIISALSDECENKEILEGAVKLSNGKVSEALKKYQGESVKETEKIVFDVFTKMQSSKDIAIYSSRIDKNNFRDVITMSLGLVLDVLRYKNNSLGLSFDNQIVEVMAEKYSVGALLHVSEKLQEIEKSLYFNGNIQALVDSMLFGILEGKYKWSK